MRCSSLRHGRRAEGAKGLAEGAESVRRALGETFASIGLEPAIGAQLDRYLGERTRQLRAGVTRPAATAADPRPK